MRGLEDGVELHFRIGRVEDPIQLAAAGLHALPAHAVTSFLRFSAKSRSGLGVFGVFLK
jgi:hypothetical protein